MIQPADVLGHNGRIRKNVAKDRIVVASRGPDKRRRMGGGGRGGRRMGDGGGGERAGEGGDGAISGVKDKLFRALKDRAEAYVEHGASCLGQRERRVPVLE